jgi:hypothetical protein
MEYHSYKENLKRISSSVVWTANFMLFILFDSSDYSSGCFRPGSTLPRVMLS